ncbi:MAG: alpha/beta hydrolase family protein [Povalibacter sp.]
MRITIVCLAVMLVAGCGQPFSRTPAERKYPTLEFSAVSLPSYESERGIAWAASNEDYARALSDSRFVMQQFTYLSDGLTVGAYLYREHKPTQAHLPVIVFNRGSYTRPNGFAGEMLVMAHRYAQAGFVVVAPHYRGSNGWSGRDELGGAELHDLFNIVPYLSLIEGVDPTRIFLSGESRGGAMVYMALRDGFPARAAAVWGAFSDLSSLIAPGQPQAKYAPLIWPDLEQRREVIVQTRSAVQWADRLNAPILIMHGGADEDIPVEQSQRMDEELTRLRKTHELIVFEGQQHVIGGRGAERDAAAIGWFRRFATAAVH